MNGLDLFSGIGGISLALAPWSRTIAYCESDRYAQSVLLSRMADGLLDNAPIWDDIRSLKRSHLPPIDLVFGGFPCQDISTAGRGEGLEGKRSGLFFEVIRLVDELRPSFVFLENVAAIVTRGLGTVLGEFTELGYDCRWTIVSASELGAPHQRRRWFLLAHTDRDIGGNKWETVERENAEMGHQSTIDAKFNGDQGYVADAYCEGLERQRRRESQFDRSAKGRWWKSEPAVGRVVNGLPHRVDRIRCLGNSVVPMQAREAFERLSGMKSL